MSPNATESDPVDVIVIGGGPAGENAAARAVRGGLGTVLVENELLGGECSYWACMPSKALLRDPEVLAAARRVPGARAAATGTLDVAAVLARRDSFASNWDDASQVRWAQGAGIELVRGTGSLVGERQVRVEGPDGSRTLRARHAVILATGSVPVIPPVPGLREASPWTSREGTSAKQVPESLAVIGGGVVACELATAWSSLGARVTMLVRDHRLLEGHEPFACELVLDGLRAAGVDVRMGVETLSVTQQDATSTLTLSEGEPITVAEILVATGRRPRTHDVGLESVGLDPSQRLVVDDSLRVDGLPWLYAVGDVNGRALLTHMGKYQARVAGDAVAARARGEEVTLEPWEPTTASADHSAVPGVVFTDPAVASVGLTSEQAEQQGLDVRVVDYELGDVAGASLLADGYTGRARAVVDEKRRVLLGVTFVGPEVAELVHAATIAVVGEVPIDRLWHAVPSYPTMSEVWLRLLETYGL